MLWMPLLQTISLGQRRTSSAELARRLGLGFPTQQIDYLDARAIGPCELLVRVDTADDLVHFSIEF